MTIIYLVAALFGVVFLVPMLMGGIDIDSDFDLDLDLDVGGSLDLGDIDGDLGSDGFGDFVDGDVPGDIGAHDTKNFGADAGDMAGLDAFVASLLSFRSIVFFITFFGVSGLVLTVLGSGDTITLVTSIVLGLFAAVLHAQLFAVLRRKNTSSQLQVTDLEGQAARVVLPINGVTKGRVRADIGGQPTFLVAQSYTSEHAYDVGESVVVVTVEDGTAMVAGLDL